MTKAQTQYNVTNLTAAINALRKQCQAWELGVFRTSNDELYAILQKCHLFLENLRSAPEMRSSFTKALAGLGIQTRGNTSLELKVVKAVFGKENKRIHAYVRLLQAAKKDLPKGKPLSDWIVEHGGVEEIRRKPKGGPTPAERAKSNREHAEQSLVNIDPVGSRFDPDDSLQPDSDSDYPFSVALVRVDSDGKAAVVFGTNKTTLVRAVLSEAGAKLKVREGFEKTTSKYAEKRKQRDDVLEQDDEADDDQPSWNFRDFTEEAA
ncbi:MAG: hypothetical protein NXI16_16490 [Alphaproteobacteria bacterium]|nr:hypothetical protein [Alphaproteobacteria bacterium]